MCTCGIDIATQQATPAMHSSACARAQATGRTAARDGAPACGLASARPPPAGGRGRIASASSGSVTAHRTPSADVGRAPADRLDEVLHDRRPDRAGQVVAAGADRHRDAAPAHEPQRRVGHQRREGRRRSRAGRCTTPCAIANSQTLLASAAADEAQTQARSADQHRPHHAVAVGQPPHQHAADAEADHQQRVGQRGIGARDAELGLHRRQHHRHHVHAGRADGHQRQRGGQARPGVAGVGRVLAVHGPAMMTWGRALPRFSGTLRLKLCPWRARHSDDAHLAVRRPGVYPIAPTPFARRRRDRLRLDRSPERVLPALRRHRRHRARPARRSAQARCRREPGGGRALHQGFRRTRR